MIENILKQKDLIRTSLFFLAIIAALNLLIYLLFKPGLLDPFLRITTVMGAHLINLFGIKASTVSNKIFLSNRVFNVTLECTATYIIAIYSALVIAYPAPWDKRVKGLLVGIPSILVANLIRLLVVAIIAVKLPGYFDYVHDYIWRVAFIMLTAALWLAWAEKGTKDEAEEPVCS